MSRLARRLAFAALLALTLFAATPALAVDAPILRFGRAHWDVRVVDVAIDYRGGPQRISLQMDGVEATHTDVTGTSGTWRPSVPIAQVSTLRAIATTGTEEAASLGLRIDPATYLPRLVRTGLAANRLVGPRLAGTAVVDAVRAKRVYVRINGRDVWARSVSLSSNLYPLPSLSMPAGRSLLRVGVRNAWGVTWSLETPVYNLGAKVPSASTFLMIDKSSCYLYHVRSRAVVRTYPVAVGMPYTPTPEGYFILGAPAPASGAWGVLRMRLSRRTSSGTYPTYYYIHGTNQPDSIGTWASHGCIRMYNWDVRRLAGSVSPGYLVFIRY